MIYRLRNNTLFNGNSLELINKLYHKLKVGKKFFTSKSINKMCYDFHIILRYAYGLTTPYELRKYLVNKDVFHEDILIPCEQLIHSFLRELLVTGLAKIAEKTGNEVKDFYLKYLSHYETLPDFDLNKLQYVPLTHALYNRTVSIVKTLRNFRNNPKMDLVECMTHMRLEKVDSIVSLKRETTKTFTNLDKL